jgi:hypothetical protein
MKLHRGNVLAWGLLFVQPGREMLELWSPGCQLLSVSDGPAILRFERPRRWNAERGAGAPLVESGGAWSTFTGATLQPGQVHWVWAGEHRCVALSQLRDLDLRPWLAHVLGPLEEGRSLADGPWKPVDPALAVFDARRELTKKPAPEGHEELVRTLQERRAPRKVPEPTPPQQSGPFDWMWEQLSRIAARFNKDHNQQYLDKMVELFERGQLDEALRYGIPLGTFNTPAGREFVGRLQPRESLEIRPGGRDAPSSLPVKGSDYLRQLYRQALQKLLESGQIEAAVYLQVELLDDVAGALALLEQKQLYGMAARLAEARKLPADVQIRLHFLDGNVERALQIARRTGLYWQAYHALKKVDETRARRWLREWGLALLRAGLPYNAARVLWPERESCPEVYDWLRTACGREDVQAAEALALWLADPGTGNESELEQRLRERIDARDYVGDRQFETLLKSMPLSREDPLISKLAGPLVREALSRLAEARIAVRPDEIRKVCEASEDRWLRADLPRWTAAPVDKTRVWAQRLEGKGTTPILDAVMLPDGRSLLALGEAGLLVLSRRGNRQALLPLPCHGLVVPWKGDRVLLMQRRSEHDWSLTWLDVASLRAESWCNVRLDWFAQEYDGDSWLVGMEDSLYQIDAQARGWRSLAKVTGPGRLLDACLGPSSLGVVWDTQAQFYTYPLLEPRHKGTPREFITPHDIVGLQRPSQGVVELLRMEFPLGSRPVTYVWGRRWSLVTDYEREVWLFPTEHPWRAVHIEVDAASWLHLRLVDELLILADDTGRYAVADLERRKWVLNLRL